jgi:hypothetical protein
MLKFVIAAALPLLTGVALADPCPDHLMTGTFRSRPPDARIWDMRAVVNGKIMLTRPDSAITGHSKVTCSGGQLTAVFSGMSDHHAYRCDGQYSSQDFLAVCKLDGSVRDIAGQFSR